MTTADPRALHAMMEDLIPIAAAAERKGCSHKAIIKAGRRGDLELVKIAGDWWVSEVTLKRWMPGAHLAHVRGIRE